MVLLHNATNGCHPLESTTKNVSLRGDRQPSNQRGDVRLLTDREVPRTAEITPEAIPPVLVAIVVQGFRGDDQLGGEDIGTIPPSSERPERVADVDVVKRRVPLVQVVRRSFVEISNVVIGAPMIEQRHGLGSRISGSRGFVRTCVASTPRVPSLREGPP